MKKNAEIRKKRNLKMDKLLQELKNMEAETRKNPKDEVLSQKTQALQKQISLLMVEEMERNITLAKQKYFEFSNKPSKWLAWKIKRKKEKKTIWKIREGDHIYSEQEQIKKVFYNYYQNLFAKKFTDIEEMKNYLNGEPIQKIGGKERNELNREISLKEISDTIKELKTGKTPGPDGLSTLYYKKLQNKLIHPLQAVMNDILNNSIPNSWKDSFITLFYKEKRD